jgi:hypothetical protein
LPSTWLPLSPPDSLLKAAAGLDEPSHPNRAGTMITNEQLRKAFLSPQMKFYFGRKLPGLSSDEVDARIEELLKYLNMAIHEAGDIPFTEEIDEVWHYWILETKEYAALCAKLHGGQFLHHSSNDYLQYGKDETQVPEYDVQRGLGILSSYVLNYGPIQPDRVRYWPLIEALMAQLEWDLDTLNRWLASVHALDHPPLAEEVAA